MLAASQTNHLSRMQGDLVVGLVCKLCKEERHRQALANGGVLDLLSMRLASFAVRDGYVVPGAEARALADGLSEVFPEPAPPAAKIGHVLEAINAILGDSKYRAARFINSPAILTVFPPIKATQFPIPSGNTREADYAAAGLARPRWLTAMEYILPVVPTMPSKTSSSSSSRSPSSTPSRSGTHTPNRGQVARSSVAPAVEGPRVYPAADVESPTIPWLVHLVRSLSDYERLMAASVLASLFRAGLGTMLLREASLGLLVVPVLIGLITKYDTNGAEPPGGDFKLQRLVRERAPNVLARLISDCESLQKAVFECDAVKTLTKLLRNAYQPVLLDERPHYWSPHADTDMDSDAASPVSQLGASGLNQQLQHQIRVREAALKAIGSLVSIKEEYRKALIKEDFIPYVVESLAEFPGKPKPARDRSKDKFTVESPAATPTPGYGKNPLSVIIAACYVVRMISRSVNILRTALVDYAIAMPVFSFLRHADIGVQIAATATVINMVVEVSPVREMLSESGLMKVLCEHAHSDNNDLRLNSLWALKHFVDAVNPEMKKACLEQLEPGWLVQLICDDDEEDNDLYAAATRALDDVDEEMAPQHVEIPIRWMYATRGNTICEIDTSQSDRLRQVEDYLTAIREEENNPSRRARNDDLAIQEQGLDFIRNFIGRPMAPDTADVIDYLFSAIGQDRLFEILASKLKPKALNPFGRRTLVAGKEARIQHPRPKIIVAVIYVLVHLAASMPRHRQLVISQSEILKLLAQQASSKDKEVRSALCHFIINLTWKDDDSEAQACTQRSQELKKLGFLAKMEHLKRHDPDLDVRERAKNAVAQMEEALS